MVGINDRSALRDEVIELGFNLELVGKGCIGILARLRGPSVKCLVRPLVMKGMQSCDLEPGLYTFERLVPAVIVSVVPLWIAPNRLCPRIEPRNQIEVRGRSGDRRHDALDHLGIARCPFVSLQSAHGGAHNLEPGNPEAVDQRLLHPHEILDAHDREGHAIGLAGIRIDCRRARGYDIGRLSIEIDQRVRREYVILAGINRLAGTDDPVPIAGAGIACGILAESMRGAGEKVRDQDGIRFVGIERAGRLPPDPHILDGGASDGLIGWQREGLLFHNEVLRKRRRA